MKMFNRNVLALAAFSAISFSFCGAGLAEDLAPASPRTENSGAAAPEASAGSKSGACLENLKKYRLSNSIAAECVAEAEESDASPELLYTVGLWFVSGEHDLFVSIKPDERKARHFLYNAAKKGSADARQTYVVTQMNHPANDGVDNKGVAINFLKEMEADKTDDGFLRFVTTLKAVHRLKKEHAERVKAMADADNYKAAFIYADILQASTLSMKNQADINKAMKEAEFYYNRVLMHYRDKKDEESRSLVARVYWNLIKYYVRLSAIEQYRQQSQQAVLSYLEILAKMGDLMAASNLAISYHLGDWGRQDDDASYAWTSWVRNCAPGSMYSQGLKVVNKELTLKVPVEELDKRRERAPEFTAGAVCLEKNLPVRPGDAPEGLSVPAAENEEPAGDAASQDAGDPK